MRTRAAAVAGMFYPKSREELEKMLLQFLKNVPASTAEKELKALLVPHAGYVYSGQVAAYAYALLQKYKKKKIIMLGPSHYTYFNGVASDVNDFWETPLGMVRVAENDFPKLREAHLEEHSLEVQVPFLQKTLEKFEILPIVAGDADPKKISEQIKKTLGSSLLLISSDLSHYHDYDTAVRLDTNSCRAIQNLDYDRFEKEGEACGKIPVLTLIDIAKSLNWKCKLLNYQNSGHVTADKSRVVGYASFAIY
jgi:hypothetical protein